MPVLRFPSDRAVGTLEFVGSWSAEGGPLLARGEVTVPDGVEIGLMPMNVQEVDATGGGGWSITSGPGALDLEFLRDLPSDAITSFGLSHRVQETSFAALSHLAPGLRRANLGWAGLTDQSLPTLARLTQLVSLQTFGNQFTDAGVQQLVALAELTSLSLEEGTLTLAAFEFVDRLPKLTYLGVQEVRLGKKELKALRRRLPGVRVNP